jgi:hypothetical protein
VEFKNGARSARDGEQVAGSADAAVQDEDVAEGGGVKGGDVSL